MVDIVGFDSVLRQIYNNMQLTVAACCLLTLVSSAAAEEVFRHYHIIPVLRRTEVHDQAGQYALGYETANGITVREQGALKRNAPTDEYPDDLVMVKKGSFSYTGPDGRLYSLSYLADENGFQPIADHLPVSPKFLAFF